MITSFHHRPPVVDCALSAQRGNHLHIQSVHPPPDAQVFGELLDSQRATFSEHLERVMVERTRKLHSRVAELERELVQSQQQCDALVAKGNSMERQLMASKKSKLTFADMLGDGDDDVEAGRKKELIGAFLKLFGMLSQTKRRETIRALLTKVESKGEQQMLLQDLVLQADKEQLLALVAVEVKSLEPAERYQMLCEVYTLLGDAESADFVDWLPGFLQGKAPRRFLQAFFKMAPAHRATFLTSLLNDIGPIDEAVVLEYRKVAG